MELYLHHGGSGQKGIFNFNLMSKACSSDRKNVSKCGVSSGLSLSLIPCQVCSSVFWLLWLLLRSHLLVTLLLKSSLQCFLFSQLYLVVDLFLLTSPEFMMILKFDSSCFLSLLENLWPLFPQVLLLFLYSLCSSSKIFILYTLDIYILPCRS